MQSCLLGPCRVVEGIGSRSYRVQVKPTVVQDVHQDHMKPVLDSVVTQPLYDLFHYQGVHQDYETTPDEHIVDKIVGHRMMPGGDIEFKVNWKGFDDSDDSWEPVSAFIMKYNSEFLWYFQEHGLDARLNVLRYLRFTPTEEDL